MPVGKVYLKKGDLVRWIGPSGSGFIGKTAVVVAITHNNPRTLVVEDTTLMNAHGLGGGWGALPNEWEVVEKVNPHGEWGEEGL